MAPNTNKPYREPPCQASPEFISIDCDDEQDLENELIDKSRCEFDTIVAHKVLGQGPRYLQLFKGRTVEGDVQRQWLSPQDMGNKSAPSEARDKVVRGRSLHDYAAKVDHGHQTLAIPKRDASTQVNMDSRAKIPAQPKLKFVFNKSTQTELTYFVWHSHR